MAKQAKQIDEYQQQAAQFAKDAAQLGLDSDFLFKTALERYTVQVQMLQRLKGEIDRQDATVKREYVRGSASTYVNPLISEFNKTASAANQTCNLLAKLKAEAEKKADELDFLSLEL